jgi:carbamoyltransferase
MWTVALNIKDGGIALFKNDELEFFIQEERLSKLRYDASPYLGMDMISKFLKNIGESVAPKSVFTGGKKYYEVTPINYKSKGILVREAYPRTPWTGENAYLSILRKNFLVGPHDVKPLGKSEEIIFNEHFVKTVAGFKHSRFTDSAVIIIDSFGNGFDFPRYSQALSDTLNMPADLLVNDTWELESIWSVNFGINKQEFKKYYSNYGSNTITSSGNVIDDNDVISEISTNSGIVKAYEAVNTFLNFHHSDITKTMFLAAYGKEDPRIIIHDKLLNNSKLIKTEFPKISTIINEYDTELFKNTQDCSWHDNPKIIDEYKKDLAYAMQESAFTRVCTLIEKAIDLTGKNNIVIAGKINYNYRINYRLLKKFPHIKFYHDAIGHCGGNFFGGFYNRMKPLETMYIGPNITDYYSKQSFEGYDLVDATPTDIAQLISDENIVALFQGRSEAGANPLGNRSILFDPTIPNGRKTLSKLKNKKWFETYSASCLLEFAHEWFDMAGLVESPFMMYAVDVLDSRKNQISNVTHIDGSCLVQTVTHTQNANLYDLLVEFNKIKNVPILLNTGFHLENSPLVETLDDAIFAINNLDINYLWLPDINKMAVKILNNN